MISGYSNITLAFYKFREFVDGESDFSGNQLTGVPSNQLTSGIRFSIYDLAYAKVDINHIGEIPITDDNTVFSEAFTLVHCLFGIRRNLTDKIELDIWGRINNVLDEKYASMLAVNSVGFGGAAPRYYYPGLPRHYQGGIKLKYTF